MAKLPFGGSDDEPAIDRRADPKPLLEEIAACLYEGNPLRPRLAEWFYDAWKSGRVHVKGVRGTRRADCPEQVSDLLYALREFEGQPGIEKQIERLLKEFKIKASMTTIHAWRHEIKKFEDDESAAWAAELEQISIRAFQAFAKEGIVGGRAIKRVSDLLDESHLPTDETLKRWQWIAEHTPCTDQVE